MNELALFAGCGGGLLASNLLGINTICAVERDEYCQHVLVQRQNEGTLSSFPIWDDVCTFDGRLWRGSVDVISGGFPCQAFSTAAHGRNITEKNLWGEMLRIIREVCPSAIFAENVSEKAIKHAQKDLLESGYNCLYKKLSAKDVGADHKRTRFWLLAYSDDYRELFCSEYAKTQKLQELRGDVWKAFPGEFRVPNGLAFWMDRIKALGNGQVPLVAASAWIELHDMILDKEPEVCDNVETV